MMRLENVKAGALIQGVELREVVRIIYSDTIQEYAILGSKQSCNQQDQSLNTKCGYTGYHLVNGGTRP